jgi:sugar-specific transcriptional regulator TrmB
MKEIEHLENLGLNRTEARVYLALQEIGESKTGKICDNLDIATSHIYRILDSLIKKGLVSYKLFRGIKIFRTTDPQNIQNLYAQKKKELDQQESSLKELIRQLQKKPKHKETISDYQYFEGYKGIVSLWNEFYRNLDPGTTIDLCTSRIENWEKLNEYYLENHRLRVANKVSMRMLIPETSPKKQLRPHILERKKIGLISIRQLKSANVAEFAVYKNILVIQETSKETKHPRGFLIRDQIFADSFRMLFENLWMHAKI